MNLNRPNEYGVPLHACNGYRQDEHRWVYLQFLIDGGAMVSTGVASRDGNTGMRNPQDWGNSVEEAKK